jgi:hypothetical protein
MATKTHVTTDTTQSLSNKTLDNTSTINVKDGNLLIQDNADPTKQARLETSGVTAGQTRVMTVPDFDGTITTIAGTQVLTNKDIDGGTATNTSRMTIPKDTLANLQALTRKEGTIVYATDTDKFYSDNGSTLTPVGSGGGSGAKSYATEDDSTADNLLGPSWSTADDGSYPPVDGAGGTVTATFTRTTSSPLQGAGSMLFTPGGQYDSAVFTFPNGIDRADLARMMKIEFDYEFDAGSYTSYTDGDIKLAVVCASNLGFTTDLQVIQPAGYSILKVAGQETHVATFQSHASNLYYRVCLVQTTASVGYTVKLDNFKVGPQSVAYGCPVTDWQSYTLAVTSTGSAPAKGTNTVDKAMWRRVGDSLEIEWQYVASGAGTAGTGTYLFGLPSGLTIDTTKITADTNSISALVGSGIATFVSGNTFRASLSMNVYNTTNLSARIHPSTSNSTTLDSSTVVGGGSYDLGSSSATYSFSAKVPILGWSSNVVVSDSADTRVVAARYTISGAKSTSHSFAVMDFDTKVFDTHNAVTTGAGWKFTAPVPGYYRVTSALQWGSNTALAGDNWLYIVELYKNGTTTDSYLDREKTSASYSSALNFASGSSVIYLNAGEYIQIRVFEEQQPTATSASQADNWVAIERISGPAQIAASASVYASVNGATQGITENTLTTLTFGTTRHSSHGAGLVDTANNRFVAPVAGAYEVNCLVWMDATPNKTPSSIACYALVNGSSYLYINNSTINNNGVSYFLLSGWGSTGEIISR